MASFWGSVKNMFGDAWWPVKLGLFSAAVFYVLYIEYDYPPNDQRILMYKLILGIIFLGIASVSMNRNINNKSPFFPGLLAIPETLMRMVFSVVAILPGAAMAYFLNQYLMTLNMEPVVWYCVYTIAVCVLAPFVFMPVVYYSVRGNILDACRINLIFEGAGNVIVQALSYILQAALIGGAVTVVFYFLILQMLGDHVALLILQAVVIVFLYFSIFSFASDLYVDVIPEIKDNVKPKRKLSKEEAIAQRKENAKRVNRAGGANRPVGENRPNRPNRPDRPNRPNRPDRPNRPRPEQ